MDAESILSDHAGTLLFVNALHGTKTGEQLLRVLGGYVQFNATFGSGVAHLAGEIGVRTDLFRDSDDPVAVLADRSVEVAAVFFTAIDEFGDRISLARCTHCSLVQATIKGVAEYLALACSEGGRGPALRRCHYKGY
ncbi:MAG: hypothetical protein JO138_17565 [Acidobacteriaceae bacterium]|nr:hypothetical protein [Acidobacteriaceae bacterium]